VKRRLRLDDSGRLPHPQAAAAALKGGKDESSSLNGALINSSFYIKQIFSDKRSCLLENKY
jgi:hypothetical protein